VEREKGFWLRTCGIVIGIGVLCLIGLVIFDRLVYRFGAIAALVIVFAILMAIAYRADRKQAHSYDESDS